MVSEFMLQQTRVETVVPFYARWLQEFPSVEALAEASQEDVLQQWKGLGYYSRARRLHQAAMFVRERFGGKIPSEVESLLSLPGVGEYTAGAVASIAFGKAVPAVDGNVRRVLARLFDVGTPTPKQLKVWAGALVDPDRPGAFNEALMELGALICTPRAPACETCPVVQDCLAFGARTVGERPTPTKKKTVPEGEFAVAVSRRADGRMLVMRRSEKGMLAGMWEFPTVEVGLSETQEAVSSAAVKYLEELGLDPGHVMARLPTIRHVYSHLKARYRGVVVEVGGGDVVPSAHTTTESSEAGSSLQSEDAFRWLSFEELDRVPLSVAQQRIAAEVVSHPSIGSG